MPILNLVSQNGNNCRIGANLAYQIILPKIIILDLMQIK
jgi:hypothetical protein